MVIPAVTLTAPCLVCSVVLAYVPGYGWAHPEGGLYVTRCTACAWSGAPRPAVVCCPCCRGAVRDDHCAQPAYLTP